MVLSLAKCFTALGKAGPRLSLKRLLKVCGGNVESALDQRMCQDLLYVCCALYIRVYNWLESCGGCCTARKLCSDLSHIFYIRMYGTLGECAEVVLYEPP